MIETDQATILIVDDVEAGRYATGRILGRAGFRVVEGACGADCLRLARGARKPDLIVLDIHMPDMDGFEVCRQLKADPATANIPVLHLTATCREDHDKIYGLNCGADAFLTQPVPSEELVATVSALLRVRQAERKAQDLARNWQRTFDAISDGIGLLDAQGCLVRSNRGLQHILGWDADALTGVAGQALLLDLFGSRAASLFTPTSQPRELEMMELGGEQRWFRVTLDPIRDDSNELSGTVLVMSDMTRLKRDEDAQRESEQKLRVAIGAAELGTWVYTFDDNICLYDEQAQKLYGLSEPTFLHDAQGAQKLFHPADIPLMWQRVQAAVDPAGDGRYQVDYRVLLPGGGVRWLNAWGQVEFTGEGRERRPVRMVGASRDISERKQAEEALRQAVDRYEWQVRLFDGVASTTPDFVYLFDRQGRFLYANRRLLEVWGMQLPDVIGKTCRELGYEQWHHEMHMREIAQVIATKAPIKGEVPFKAPLTGTFGVYEYIFTPVLGPDGEVELIAGTTRDVTERKRAEEALHEANSQLAEADRRKDEFLAMLAHELRNPLAPVRNAVHILRAAGGRPDVLQRQQAIIDRQTTHMARLLDDLLDVSRITRGKITLQKQQLCLTDVLLHVVETVTPLIRSRHHTLHFDPPLDELRVEGDLDRLAQAVGNVLINAAKYTDEGGRIWLETVREDGHAVVRVRDTGVGIAPEMLPKVFDLFTQADRSLDRSQGGLGIGLTMVKRLVEMHGGAVEAHSAGIGQGSEFIIRLPALPAEPGYDESPNSQSGVAAAPACPPARAGGR